MYACTVGVGVGFASSFWFFITLPAMLAARARAAGTAWRSGLPALTGGAARALCVPSHHIHPEMPDKWRRLSECRRPLALCHHAVPSPD